MLFNTILEVLADSISKEKEIEGTQIRKDAIKLSFLLYGMINFEDNLKELEEKHLLELLIINEYSKVAVHR